MRDRWLLDDEGGVIGGTLLACRFDDRSCAAAETRAVRPATAAPSVAAPPFRPDHQTNDTASPLAFTATLTNPLPRDRCTAAAACESGRRTLPVPLARALRCFTRCTRDPVRCLGDAVHRRARPAASLFPSVWVRMTCLPAHIRIFWNHTSPSP